MSFSIPGYFEPPAGELPEAEAATVTVRTLGPADRDEALARRVAEQAEQIAQSSGESAADIEAALWSIIRAKQEQEYRDRDRGQVAAQVAPGTRRYKARRPVRPIPLTNGHAFGSQVQTPEGAAVAYAPRVPGHEFTSQTATYVVGERGEVRRVGRVKQTKKQRVAARRAASNGGK